mmetsp:Transcript_33680/g.77715  ORF Transcript_33680/g.77715 Transcript_33680/m.77715 type:complete len:82 (-) Transcript_33680:1326-1571(-)
MRRLEIAVRKISRELSRTDRVFCFTNRNLDAESSDVFSTDFKHFFDLNQEPDKKNKWNKYYIVGKLKANIFLPPFLRCAHQ